MSLWQQLSTKTNSRENGLLVHRSLKWTGATDNLPRTPIFAHRKGSLPCYFPRYVLINHKLYHVRRSEDKRRFLLNEDLFSAKERRPESVASPVWWAFVTSRGVPSHNSESFGEKLETYPSVRKNYTEKKRSLTFLQHKVMVFLHVCLLFCEKVAHNTARSPKNKLTRWVETLHG